MDATEICPLTEEAVATLLASRGGDPTAKGGDPRRKVPRWPFPGTVELWVPNEQGQEEHVLATSLNLSIHGVGVQADQRLAPGMTVSIAIHEPEMSFHGRATVRHCTQLEDGYYMGMQFCFDNE